MKENFRVEISVNKGGEISKDFSSYEEAIEEIGTRLAEDIILNNPNKSEFLGKEDNLKKDIIFELSCLKPDDLSTVNDLISHTISGTMKSYGCSSYNEIRIIDK